MIAEGKLFIIKNNGGVYAISQRTGKPVWRRDLGQLAASTPAYANGRIYVTMLKRDRRPRTAASPRCAPRTARSIWSKPLPSRTESSPLFAGGRVYFGSEDGTVYALRAKDGSVAWRYKAAGAVKGALALADGKLYFGDYGGRVHAIRAEQRQAGVVGGDQRRPVRHQLRAVLRQRRPSPTAASTSATPTPTSTRSPPPPASSPGARARAATSTPPPPSRRCRAASRRSTSAPTTPASTRSTRRPARCAGSTRRPGRISGAATVVGDIVYFGDLKSRTTTGLGARTGRKVFRFGRGGFNPVVSDGRFLYLVGYSSLVAAQAEDGALSARTGTPAAARCCLSSATE